jgi:type IV secretory pathway TraG/TraD family ATPase VirD4
MPRAARFWVIFGVLFIAFFTTLHFTIGIDNFTAMARPHLTWLSGVGTVYFALLLIFVSPSILLMHVLGINLPSPQMSDTDVYTLVYMLVLVIRAIFSWFVWSFSLSRFWKLIGRWNPFGANIDEMRPYHLKIWVWLRELFEREGEFGQHATGGFAGIIEVLSNRFKFGDIFLGRPKLFIGGMLRPIGIPTEKHMVTIAGTGSGKSTGALIPNLCLHWGSLLCVDPKGELAAITARRRGDGGGGVRGMRQKVYVLNPHKLPGLAGFQGASYNVFDEMARVAAYDPDRPVSYAHKVAQALVPSTSRDPYWDEAPRQFIMGLLLHIFQGPPEKRNLVRLRTLIMEGDAETYGSLQRAGARSDGDAFDALLTMMKNAPASPYQHVIAGTASSLSTMAPNQRGSVMSMAMHHTSFLDIPEIRHISMKSDFLLEDLKNENISVYLCLPLNAISGLESRWLRMFVLLTVDMMTRVNKAPDPPLLMAIDEFPSLGKLDGIESVAPTMRSQGVRLWVVGQDIKQFEAVYPESWDSFIGGAEAVQFMGVTHPPTVEYIAARLGQHVVTERTGQGAQMREMKSERPVRDAEQIARLLSPSDKNQIIWRGNKRPMLLKITPYFSYMPWWYYSRDPRFKQKFRQWFWRRGKDPAVMIPPPPAPAHIPPPPPDGPPPTYESVLEDIGRRGGSDSPPLPTDNVPGTSVNWLESLKRNPNVPPQPPEAPPEKPKIRPTAKSGAGAAMAELDGLIGLDEVKKQVRKTINLIQLGEAQKKKGMPVMNVTPHLVFTGNPGTGKKTVARIVGQIYRDIGLLKSGHLIEADRSTLVGGLIRQTAPKTQKVIDEASGGVLFIDDAYSLVPAGIPNDFGGEAIATLIKSMEDQQDNLVVIVAGYKEEMGRFIDSNTRLKSRFKTIIDFEDYTADELFKIFVSMVRGRGMRLSADATAAAAWLMEKLEPGVKGFGNGRTVRNIFEECLARQGQRFSDASGRIDVSMFEKEDIPRPGEMDFA